MVAIQYFFSVLSPFAYLAGSRLESLAAKHGASVVYKPMNIAEVFGATGGTPPKDRHPSRQSYRLEDLERTARFHDMAIHLQPAHWPVDPKPASVAIIAAQDAGFSVGVLSHAVLRAVWAEEKDISDPATVDGILEANGVAPSAVADHLDAAAAQFAANTAEAIELGVFGAPTYVLDGLRFWGGDRLPHLDQHLAQRTG
ncbi:MAG: 2-hydroxychromene-2-carboxylate isomerase [Pseudomonadota bacterium]